MPGFQRDVMGLGMAPALAQAINGVGAASLTATGSTQADAYAMTTCSNEFTTVAASTGARLPIVGAPVSVGDIVAVYNKGANTLTVYPPVGGAIMLSAANAGVSVASGKSALFGCRGDGNWFSIIGA